MVDNTFESAKTGEFLLGGWLHTLVLGTVGALPPFFAVAAWSLSDELSTMATLSVVMAAAFGGTLVAYWALLRLFYAKVRLENGVIFVKHVLESREIPIRDMCDTRMSVDESTFVIVSKCGGPLVLRRNMVPIGRRGRAIRANQDILIAAIRAPRSV